MRKSLVLTLALAISGSAFADTCMVSPTSKEQVSGRFGKFGAGHPHRLRRGEILCANE